MNEKQDNVPSSKRKGMPLRYFLLFNSFFAFIMVYANKVVLSVAIVAMVKDHSVLPPLTPLSLNTNLNTNVTHMPAAAALHSGNSGLIDNLNSNSTNPLLERQFIKEPVPINLLPHQRNQVDYDSATKSKVLG